MKIKILSFSCEIEALKNNNLFLPELAKDYPGALWVSHLKSRCRFNLEFQTIDKTVQLIKSGKVDPKTVAVFQHNIDKEADQLINLGALPFYLSMYESPLYCGEFYDFIEEYANKFHHVKIFGASLYQSDNICQAYFPCFSQEELRLTKGYLGWSERHFSSMVMGNKYVLTKSFVKYQNWRDRIWWILKFTRQYIKGPRLPKKIEIQNNQLQDFRYEILSELLKKGLLDLYGNGWDKLFRIPPSMAKKIAPFLSKDKVTSIKNKHEVISAYKFNICIENLAYPGYVTEKIFDAFIASTIPVYFGAPDIYNFIPINAFIDASKFDNIENLIDYLINMKENEAAEIIKNGNIFLRSSEGIKFSHEEISNEIIRNLNPLIKS